VQVLVLPLSRFAPPRGAAGHVVDKLMILRIEPMLVTLQEQRNRFPVRLAIGAVKIVCTVEFVSASCTPAA